MGFCIVNIKVNDKIKEQEHSVTFQGIGEGDPVVVETDRDGYPSLLKGEFVKYIEETTTSIEDLKPVVGRWLEVDKETSIDFK